MKQKPEWMEEIRQQMKERGLYTELDEQCLAYRETYEAILLELEQDQRKVIEDYVEILNRCNFQHLCTVFLLGKEEEKSRGGS